MNHGWSRTRLVLALGFAAFGLAALPGSALAATADLSIVKSDSADPVPEGAELTYTLVVANAGPDAATAVTVDDDVPNELDIVAATATQGSCDIQGKKVGCELGLISSGSSVTATIRVRPRKTGQISNTATVETTDTDSLPTNNSDTETTLVTEPSAEPTCAGRAATIVGTTGTDTLTGTAGADVPRVRT